MEKKKTIRKVDLENAIRIFVSVVLFREKDKKNKIKLNCKNIFDYFKSPVLWDNKVYKNKKFIENLNELKLFNSINDDDISIFDFSSDNNIFNFNDYSNSVSKNGEESY